MLVVPWAPSKVLWVSALSASQELHQQFSAWDFHLSQLNISKFKTKLLFPYSPSPFYGKSFPFHICTTHLFLPKQTNKQNNFFFFFLSITSKPATIPSALPPKFVSGLPTSLYCHCYNQVRVVFVCPFCVHHSLLGFLLLLFTLSQQFFLHRQFSTQQIFLR